jgi:UMF1 family MFS transporter
MRPETASTRRAAGRATDPDVGRLALFGWVMFDWATQPFYTLVVTFLFAP